MHTLGSVFYYWILETLHEKKDFKWIILVVLYDIYVTYVSHVT